MCVCERERWVGGGGVEHVYKATKPDPFRQNLQICSTCIRGTDLPDPASISYIISPSDSRILYDLQTELERSSFCRLSNSNN